MRLLRRARRTEAGDERGFTLLETVIAITVLAGVFVSAGAVFSRMLIGTLYSRQNQQAADLLSEEIEHLRAESYAAVALDEAVDLSADPAITLESGFHYFDPDGAGPIVKERIVKAAGGVVDPYRSATTRNSTTYTVSRYVTDPADATGKYRRLTVVVTWTSGSRSHERTSSTFVTLTRRGLPLPNFTFSGPVSKTANQGTTFWLPVTLTNRGATDSWSLTTSNPEARPWTVRWYKDDGDPLSAGAWDVADTQLLDTDGDGAPETGALGTDEPLQLFAVVELSPAEVAGVVHPVLTARSVGQPSSPTGTASVTDTVTVVAETNCAGCTYRTHYLHNSATPGDTAAGTNLPVDLLVPTTATLSNYDTDVDAVPGRLLVAGGTNATTSGTQMANWRYAVGTKTSYGGDAVASIWVRSATVSTGTVSVTAYLNYQSSGQTYTEAGTATVVVPGDSAWYQVQFTIPVSFSLTTNKKFEVKLVAAAGAGFDNAVLAYDTTVYPARVDMPVTSG